MTATVVSDAELYGGKLCAALDRQHPRDMFDVQQLFDHGGLTDEIVQGFLVFLMSHTRPMHELLRPHLKDQSETFARQFQGMTIAPYSYRDFEATRERLIHEIHAKLQDSQRELLIGFKRGEPRWELFAVPGVEDLPAVRWKLMNIRTLLKNSAKHAEQLRSLEDSLRS